MRNGLILERKRGEAIVIGEGADMVRVEVMRCGPKVKLAIQAPQSVRIDREEVREKIDNERKEVA